VLGKPTDVLYRNENSVAIRVIKLEELGFRAVPGLQEAHARESAYSVGAVHYQLAWLKWRYKLGRHSNKLTPFDVESNFKPSGSDGRRLDLYPGVEIVEIDDRSEVRD
jgi:hypothetical protein